MNKQRRSQLNQIIEELEALQFRLETIQQEEQEYADNMPENLQGSEKHSNAEASADSLQDAVYAIDDIKSSIMEATGE